MPKEATTAYLQTDLQVKLTGTSNDVLARFLHPCLDARIRLGQTLETFDELGQIGSVLDFDSDLHDGTDGEFHDLHVVRRLACRQSTGLEQELIDTDETDDVTSRAVLDGLDVTTHHENGALNGLDEQVVLLAGNVVGALNADLGAGTDSSREDTTEGVETSLIGGGHHLGDVEDERTLGVTVADTVGRLVIHGTFIEGLDTVTLGSEGRWEVDDNHFKHGVTSG